MHNVPVLIFVLAFAHSNAGSHTYSQPLCDRFQAYGSCSKYPNRGASNTTVLGPELSRKQFGSIWPGVGGIGGNSYSPFHMGTHDEPGYRKAKLTNPIKSQPTIDKYGNIFVQDTSYDSTPGGLRVLSFDQTTNDYRKEFGEYAVGTIFSPTGNNLFQGAPLINSEDKETVVFVTVSNRNDAGFLNSRVWKIQCLSQMCDKYDLNYQAYPHKNLEPSLLGQFLGSTSPVFGMKDAIYVGSTKGNANDEAFKSFGQRTDKLCASLANTATPCRQNYQKIWDEENPVGSTRIIAIDTNSMSEIWAYPPRVGPDDQANDGSSIFPSGFSSSFVVRGARIYAVSGNKLYAVDDVCTNDACTTRQGQLAWKLKLVNSTEDIASFITEGTLPGPVIGPDGYIYISSAKLLYKIRDEGWDSTSDIHALSSSHFRDFDDLVFREFDEALSCSVAISPVEEYDDEIEFFVYAGTKGGRLFRLRGSDLSIDWEVQSLQYGGGSIFGTPLILGDLSVIFSTDGGALFYIPHFITNVPLIRRDTNDQQLISLDPEKSKAYWTTRTSTADISVNPIIDAKGRLIVGSMDRNLWVFTGSQNGGCNHGTMRNELFCYQAGQQACNRQSVDGSARNLTYSFDSLPVSARDDINKTYARRLNEPVDLCLNCNKGTTRSWSQDECVECAPGSHMPFLAHPNCFTCKLAPDWCPGGSSCAENRDPSVPSCVSCLPDHFSFQKGCHICPAASIWTSLGALLGVCFILYLLFRCTGVSSYTSGTKFTHEVAPGDIIQLSCYDVERKKKTVERTVTKVLHDYELKVDKDFSPFAKSQIRFRYKKISKMTGKGRWKAGTGLISIAPSGETADPSKTCLDRVLNCDCFAPGDDDGTKGKGAGVKRLVTAKTKSGRIKEDDAKADDSSVVLESAVKGRITSGMQIFATALVIGLGYFQVVGMISAYEIERPPVFNDFFKSFWFLGFGFELDVPSLLQSPECDWDFSFEQKWFMQVLTPLAIVSVFAVVWKLGPIFFQDPSKVRAARDHCVQSAVLVTTLIYVTAAKQTLLPNACIYEQPGADALNPSSQYMAAYPLIECCSITEGISSCDKNEGTRRYRTLLLCMYVFFILYGFGVPAFLFYVLKNAQLRGRLGDMAFIQRYGWLYLRFNRDYYYWEIVIMTRKLLIVLAEIFFASATDGGESQIFYVAGITFFFFLLTFCARPFVCYDCLKQRKKRCRHMSANDMMETGTLFGTAVFSGLSGIYVRIMASEAGKHNHATAGLAIGVIMLIVFILCAVAIFKIMYDAYKDHKREEDKLKKEGLMDDTQSGIGTMQMAMGMT